jgi:hypothetical protein
MNIEIIDVFISSTCYDLADLRAELAEYLRRRGLRVRVSEDPKSAFYVDASGDSIESRLKNVQESRAVIVVIDRRYGPPLPPMHGEISATHAEVRFAQKAGKHVFF